MGLFRTAAIAFAAATDQRRGDLAVSLVRSEPDSVPPPSYDEKVSSNDSLDDVPADATDPGGEPKARRHSGARNPISEAVVFRQGDRRIDGWALNLSRGGLRAALEAAVAVGEEFEVTIGDTTEARPATVVWAHLQKDGAIVGVAFTDVDGSVPPPPPADVASDGG